MRKVRLNHDATSVLTSKQKYAIESEIPTEVNRPTSCDDQAKQSGKKAAKKSWIETVVLKSQRSFNEEFSPLDRSQTPEFFLSTQTKQSDRIEESNAEQSTSTSNF